MRKKRERERKRERAREAEKERKKKKRERGREKKREIERDEVTWARCRVPKATLPYILYIQPLPDSVRI